MPPMRRTKPDEHRPDVGDNCVGKFLFENQSFKIVLLKDNLRLSNGEKEIARFQVHGRTLAIIEDARAPELDSETRNMITRLTGRELQIAAMIAQGDATKNVAYKLGISEWTVGTHLRRIFAKLGVDNRAAMVYRCASLIENAPQPEETRSHLTVSRSTRYGT
jgi:DNA-binding CsgD family transcriptional regulator